MIIQWDKLLNTSINTTNFNLLGYPDPVEPPEQQFQNPDFFLLPALSFNFVAFLESSDKGSLSSGWPIFQIIMII